MSCRFGRGTDQKPRQVLPNSRQIVAPRRGSGGASAETKCGGEDIADVSLNVDLSTAGKELVTSRVEGHTSESLRSSSSKWRYRASVLTHVVVMLVTI